jgi:protein O-GlcNAc transferase
MSETMFQDAVRQHRAGNLAEAARLYGAILRAQSPRRFEALYFLGFIHFQRREFAEAERLMGEALTLNPRSPDAQYNRGCALQQLQRPAEALAAFDRALALKPDYADAIVNRGLALMALARPAEALAAFDLALKLEPRDTQALGNRGTVLFELQRYEDAAANYETLIALDPEFPYVLGSLAMARAYCCDWRHRAEADARLHKDIRAGKRVLSPHAATLISADPEDQLLSARVWVADRVPPQPPLWRGERYRHQKIRVAYVSADFHAHATAYLAAGLFEAHGKDRFEIVAVSFGPDDGSAMRARLIRAFDRFIDARAMSDMDAARQLRGMEIDIAVDLKGFTQGSRAGVFALRPAPVQVNYLGHPGTMGAPYIDYIVADRTIIPEDRHRYYSEKIVRLPGSYQCNDNRRAIAARPQSRAEAGLPEDGFVFASFNNLYKITPEVFGVWMRLLAEVEGSVLWLLHDNPAAVANLRREAMARGADPARLVFAPRLPQEAHLARQRLANLFLDTLPCNAHTTASDALWAGLPVLACEGATFAGRVAASLNRAAGLSELVTASLGEYEALALRLAREPGYLVAITAKLATNRGGCALFDTARTTRHLEAAYTAMWERACRGEPPADFAVPDTP